MSLRGGLGFHWHWVGGFYLLSLWQPPEAHINGCGHCLSSGNPFAWQAFQLHPHFFLFLTAKCLSFIGSHLPLSSSDFLYFFIYSDQGGPHGGCFRWRC